MKLKTINLIIIFVFVYSQKLSDSITYINKFIKRLKKNCIGGLQLTCCGLNKAPVYKKSRKGNTLIDFAMMEVLKNTNMNLWIFSLWK